MNHNMSMKVAEVAELCPAAAARTTVVHDVVRCRIYYYVCVAMSSPYCYTIILSHAYVHR